MEKRLNLETMGRNPSEIKELNLDNCRSPNIVGLSDAYVNLEILSLNNVGLINLKGFPALPKLRKLELSDNRIQNGLSFLSGCKKLTHLNLSGNKIRDLETLKPLEEFENLRNLDLFNNEVTTIEDYRNKVFALHPSLKFLDGFDKQEREVDDSDAEEEDGEELNGNNSEEEDLGIDFSPLVIDDENLSERLPEESPSLLISLYTVYGLLFHMGYLLRRSEVDEEEEEEQLGLSAVYSQDLEEESSDGSMYMGEEEEEDDDDDVENDDTDTVYKPRDGEETHEESTRGKKRKHEDDEN